MISICIPVYNFNITSLLTAVTEEIKLLPFASEIICIDDASGFSYREANKKITEPHVYIQLEHNIGRAAIRNLFLQYAKYDNLLFLDCDSLVLTNHFVADYGNYIHQNQSYHVVCGGRVYSSQPPDRKHRLRWLYGTKKESRAAAMRNQSPHVAFMSNNFAVDRKILTAFPFDKRLTQYGHEDTLFGYALQKQNIPVHHIENPVLNGHLETNDEYLVKTEQAVANLAHIVAFFNGEKAFIEDVSLLRFYYKTISFKNLIRFAFSATNRIIKVLLSNGYISLALFDFYKLGFLAKKMKRM